jgi:hypothetical protein
MVLAPAGGLEKARHKLTAGRKLDSPSEAIVTEESKANQEIEKCDFVMTYFDDPRGSIPKSIVNWVAKSALPSMLETMKKVSENYGAYLEEQGRPPLNGLPF